MHKKGQHVKNLKGIRGSCLERFTVADVCQLEVLVHAATMVGESAATANQDEKCLASRLSI